MVQFSGVLTKMKTEWTDPVQYFLDLENDFLALNQFIGKTITWKHDGFECLACGLNKKIFRQGMCFECFQTEPQAGEWIFRPELSRAHLDEEDRDLVYEKKMQLQPHIVYLALSGGLKVGVTRVSQIPTRWIDQGATAAIPLVEVPNRYLAGSAEVALKSHYNDKTSWQKMLKNHEESTRLEEERAKAAAWLPEEVKTYYSPETPKIYTFKYPVENYPAKVTSVGFDKTPTIQDKLSGIRGQYLIFESGRVLNIRNHEGYRVVLQLG